MSEPFLGEIKIISWNYAPKGWALCNGQFLPINQNQALFSFSARITAVTDRRLSRCLIFAAASRIHAGDGFVRDKRVARNFIR